MNHARFSSQAPYFPHEPARIHESPFSSIVPKGTEVIFPEADLDEFFDILEQLHYAVVV